MSLRHSAIFYAAALGHEEVVKELRPGFLYEFTEV